MTTPVPVVGMGITLLHYSDRSTGTITRVATSGKRFWFQKDRAIRTDTNGMSDSQQYRYEGDPGAEVREARISRNSQWKATGGWKIILGERRAYHDYSF